MTPIKWKCYNMSYNIVGMDYNSITVLRRLNNNIFYLQIHQVGIVIITRTKFPYSTMTTQDVKYVGINYVTVNR